METPGSIQSLFLPLLCPQNSAYVSPFFPPSLEISLISIKTWSALAPNSYPAENTHPIRFLDLKLWPSQREGSLEAMRSLPSVPVQLTLLFSAHAAFVLDFQIQLLNFPLTPFPGTYLFSLAQPHQRPACHLCGPDPCPLLLGFLVVKSDHPWQPFSAWMSPKPLLLQALCKFHILDVSF